MTPLWIFLKRSFSVWALNGTVPVSRTYIMAPQAQTSAAGPLYSFLLTISGHIYDGVPQKTRSFSREIHANPKSIILIIPV